MRSGPLLNVSLCLMCLGNFALAGIATAEPPPNAPVERTVIQSSSEVADAYGVSSYKVVWHRNSTSIHALDTAGQLVARLDVRRNSNNVEHLRFQRGGAWLEATCNIVEGRRACTSRSSEQAGGDERLALEMQAYAHDVVGEQNGFVLLCAAGGPIVFGACLTVALVLLATPAY